MSPEDRLLAHLAALAQEIGPRPAGSPAERRAAAYVSGCLQRWGYRLECISAPFAPPGRSSPFFLAAALLVAGAGLLLPVSPWLGLLLPLLLAALPQLSRVWLRRRPLTAQSENIWASRGAPQDRPPALILCAHLDTAPVLPITLPLERRLYSRMLDILQRLAIALALLATAELLGFGLAGWLVVAEWAASGLVATWLVSIDLRARFTPPAYTAGANDNASGVAVLLALAEDGAGLPDQAPAVAFLFTTAEETGLHGAQAAVPFLQQHAPAVPILCLDMVGAGSDLRYVTKEGIYFAKRSDSHLVHAIQGAVPEARPLWYTHKSGDFAAFLRAGLPACSLEITGSSLAEQAYHTCDDSLDVIQPAALNLAYRAVQDITRSLQ